jgi:hypothetical protein
MPRTEVYQLRLSKEEKAQLARMAEERHLSIANLIRERVLGRSFGLTPTVKPISTNDPTGQVVDLPGERLIGDPDLTPYYEKLVKQLEAQDRPDPVGEARNRLGLQP